MNLRRITFSAFLGFACAAAADPGSKTPAVAESQESSGVVAGQRIFIDLETGKARPPTEEERAQMAKEPAAIRKGEVKAYTMPDGTVVLPAGAVMSRVVATRGADGKLTVQCEGHADE